MSAPTSGGGPSPRKMKKLDAEDPAVPPGSDSEDENNEEYDEDNQKNYKDINSIECDIYALDVQLSREVLKVQEKYSKLRKPHFDRRNVIIEKINNFWITAVSVTPKYILPMKLSIQLHK